MRQWQNKDGSLTEAGRKHYGYGDGSYDRVSKNSVNAAKARYKAAYKDYNKKFNDAYGYSSRHSISQFFGKNKETSNKKWEDTYDAGVKSDKAKDRYKKLKQERKNAVRDVYKTLQKDASLGERFMYTDGTRKLAAKYIVDNNMSYDEAMSSVHKEAWKNAAIAYIAGGLGSIAYYEITKNN